SAVLVNRVNSIVESEHISVVAAAAKEGVVAGSSDEQVVTIATVDGVIAGTGEDKIVSVAATVQNVVAVGPGDDVVAACRAIDRIRASSQRVVGEFSAIERHRFDLVGLGCTKFVDDGDGLAVVSDQKIVKRSARVSVDTLKIEICIRITDGCHDLDDVVALAS